MKLNESKLTELELKVEQARIKARESVWEWAVALTAIHDSKLYPGSGEAKGWERYVLERWNLRRATAFNAVAWVRHEIELVPSLEESTTVDCPKTPPVTPVYKTERASRTARSNNGQKPKPNRITKHPEEHPKASAIIGLYDSGLNSNEIAREVGLNQKVVYDVIQRENIERNAQAKIDPATLSMAAQAKLDLAIRQQIRRLEQEWDAKRVLDVNRILSLRMEEWKKERKLHELLMKKRRGCINRKTFKLIWSCLHPDKILDEKQKAIYNEAFIAFSNLEKLLLDEKESPTVFFKIPKTRAEWGT